MIEDLPVNPAEPDEIAQVPTVSPGVTLARHAPLPAPRDLELPADSQRYLAPRLPSDTDALATFQIKQQVRGGKYRFAVDSAGTGFTLWTRRQGVVGRGVAGDSVGAALGFAWVPPPAAFRPRRRVEFEVT